MANLIFSQTRAEFLKRMLWLATSCSVAGAASSGPKLLIVVAHPDDEYMFAATTYRLVRELGWTADQVVITNGEAGYRYSSLAERVYGTRLADEGDGRIHLPAIRKEEVLRAGKILGVRKHFFLDQKDLGFATVASAAGTGNWNRARIGQFLYELLSKERYDAVFTLLPTDETHGHHRAATILTLEAVARLSENERPLVFGVDADPDPNPVGFEGLPGQPLTATLSAKPSITFDRSASFGYHDALSYQIVVNWVIAEHKSQGLFQNDAGKNRFEHFWLFREGSADTISRTDQLRRQLIAK
jgi:LmbE family N-acetylglucosaminyl deacetylase